MKDLIGKPRSPHERQVHTEVWQDKLEEGDHHEDLEVYRRMLLELILEKVRTVWAGFV
jgi:hypothetical protein